LNKGIITYPYSDGKIKNKLKNEYKIALARRTVREYRKEIEIDSSFQRRIKK
ncbi:MAG TPA: hypothetical protein DHV62_07700, partial [Elusimicrobia bacterium]|nr:hypothetical protein [Elusimicrobiota bacterium]